MAFNLQQITQENDLVVTVSASEYTAGSIVWNVTFLQSGNIQSASAFVSASYHNCVTPFIWGAPYVISTGCTDFISLTTNNPNTTYYIEASTNNSTPLSSTFAVYPLQLKIIPLYETDQSVCLSSYWISSGGDIYPFTVNQVKWDITESSTVSGEVNSIPYTFGDLIYPPSSNNICLSSNETVRHEYTVTFTLSDNPILVSYRIPETYLFIVNTYTKYDIVNTTFNTTLVSAYYDRVSRQFPDDFTIRWKISPADTSHLTVSCLMDSTYDLNVSGDGYGPSYPVSGAKTIYLETDNYAGSYLITVSGSNGTTWTSNLPFKPYLYLTESVILTGIVTPTQYNAPDTYLTLNVYGISSIGGIDSLFNLYNDQLLVYQNNSTVGGLVAYNRWNTSLYNFYPTEANQIAYNINPLNLFITTATTSGTPQLSTYQISISAISGDNTSLLLETDVTFNISEWASNSIFYPSFSINNELSTTDILFRDINDLPLNATIYNHSIYPPAASGDLKFTFSNGDISALPINFTSFTHNILSGLSTYTIDVCADNIIAPSWPLPQTKIGNTKTINIVTAFPIAEFVIFPQYSWNGSTFIPVLCSESLTPGPSAWGFCHTETFSCSASNKINTSFYWYIENSNPYPLTDIGHLIDAPITSNAYTSSYGVSCKLITIELPLDMPNYHYDDSSGLLVPYKNFTTTDYNQSILKKPIQMVSFLDFVSSDPKATYNPFGVDSLPLTIDVNVGLTVNTPVELSNSFSSMTWNVSNLQWTANYVAPSLPYKINLIINNSGRISNTISQYNSTPLYIESQNYQANFKPKTGTQPFSDWCSNEVYISNINMTATAYPLNPIIYTSNKFVITGQNVIFENLVPTFNQISAFIWTDRGNTQIQSTNLPYITSYTTSNVYDLTLTILYSAYNTTDIITNTFNNVVNVVNYFEPFNSNITRIYQTTQLILPNRIDECEVPANEWVTSSNINKSFDRLQENLDYLSDQSKLYDVPPTLYYGWLGTLKEGNINQFHWRVNQDQINYKYNNSLDAISDKFINLTDCAVRSVNGVGDSIIFVSNSTSVMILSSNFFATEIDTRTYKGIGDDFINIKAIDLDANFEVDSRVYILDSGKNRVVIFNYDFDLNQWKLLYTWGGFGGIGAKTKFSNPSDLFVSDDNVVWVTDSSNLCIKTFTRSGTWLNTFTSPLFTATNKPLSVVLDSENNIYVLTSKYIYKFDQYFMYINTFNISTIKDRIFKRLTICRDGGFFYLCTENSIVKIGFNGVISGEFATNHGNSLQNVYHDENRNLYIVDKLSLIKYVDTLTIINLRTDTPSLWPMSAIYIDPNEYTQDWVINRSLARYWDNLEVYRRSIIGKFTYINENGIEVPKIRTFTPQEYKILPYHKNEIYVGVNEFNTADVLNRCIDKLYNCQEILLDMIGE